MSWSAFSYYFYRFVLPIFLAAGIFYAGYNLGTSGYDLEPSGGTNLGGVELAPLWSAWKMLDEKFVGSTTPSSEEKLWGIISGLTESYKDPFTVFLPPEENKNFNDDISGSFEGVGMEIGTREGALVVIAPLKDTPAERAGILPGDRILKIDGVDSIKMPVDKAVKKIRGKAGTEVKLSVLHDSSTEPTEISIVRAPIAVPTTKTTLRNDGVFVISLYSFSAPSPGEFREALRKFSETSSTVLLLDLRNNPGGYLEAAVEMASWFLPLGKPVVREDFGGKREPQVYRSRGYDIFNDKLTLGILVNAGSASASEILAGALKDHGKATLLGEKTFGKGSVQELVPLTGGTSLKITIARWLTPSGVSISEAGLLPDVEIKLSEENLKKLQKGGGDAQLEEAVAYLLKDASKKTPQVACRAEGGTLVCN